MKLPRIVLAGISAPALPIAGLGLPIVVYLPPFFADTVGIGLGTVGLVFMLARFWDVFTDPFFGIVADRSRPPLGRRRFWLIVSAQSAGSLTWNDAHKSVPQGFWTLSFLCFAFRLASSCLTHSSRVSVSGTTR